MLITIRYYGIEIPMYGLMIVIGCILGVLIAIRFNKREDIGTRNSELSSSGRD